MALSVTYTVMDGMILGESRANVERDYVPEPIGSTAGLLDGAQTLTDTFEYWPYGEVATSSGTTNTPFTFCGTLGYFFAAGYGYVRNRFYRPDLAQWMSVDRKWPNQPAYSYCQGQPTMKIDPTGDDCYSDFMGCMRFCLLGYLIAMVLGVIACALLAAAECLVIILATVGLGIAFFPECFGMLFPACVLKLFFWATLMLMLCNIGCYGCLAACTLVDWPLCRGLDESIFYRTILDLVLGLGPIAVKKGGRGRSGVALSPSNCPSGTCAATVG